MHASTNLTNGKRAQRDMTTGSNADAPPENNDDVFVVVEHGDDLDWDDEQVSPPRSPTLRQIHPRASPSKPSPTKRHANNDQVRLQKALSTPVPVEELSPPHTSDGLLHSNHYLSTPTRRLSTSSKVEFRTPSPPNDLPELPGPPSPFDDESFAAHEPSSRGLNGDVNATMMRTPRPPGAWATTPAPGRSRISSLPSQVEDVQHSNAIATPVASLSRTGSPPPQTPAPPGGWMGTPSRRSSLRVRFDDQHPEPELSVSEGSSEPSRYFPGALRDLSQDTIAALGNEGTGIPRSRTPELRETLSVPISPRSLRKAPSIRLVDAFGSEQVPAEATADISAKANGSLRSKNAVRIVDAMGRQVDETTVVDENRRENDAPIGHTEVVSRVRQGLVDLLDGFDDR
jgi:serine/arginine repetitive matrix protein 2